MTAGQNDTTRSADARKTHAPAARSVLIDIAGSSRLGLHEVNEACSIIRVAPNCDDVQINFGVTMNESVAGAVKSLPVFSRSTRQQSGPSRE